MDRHRPIDKRHLSLILSERLPDSNWDSFSPIDWELIVHLAQEEGVAPLLYWRLSQADKVKLLPETLHASLRAMYFSTRMNNEQIIKELGKLTSLFDRAGIPVVALKGVCFALTIYPDIGLRPMADLDLLVPASKISTAVQIAKTLGYMDAAPEAFPGLNALLNGEISLKKTAAPFIMLELHNSLLVDKSFTYAVPVAWFWEQTESVEARSSERVMPHLHMLTPNAQLLYAVAHVMLKHGSRNISLRWLYDLDRLIRFYAERQRLDWDLILKQARVFQWGSALQAALSQTCEYFGSPVPDSVFANLSKHTDRHSRLIELKQRAPSTRVVEEYQNLMARKWYGKLILILGLITPSPAYMRWRYQIRSPLALPAYYLSRWWAIVKDVVYSLSLLPHNGRLESRLRRFL